VFAGELQAPSLGLDVRALGPRDGSFGELVCANPFPSRPIGIYGDESGRRFHDTYFAQNPGFWTHGDLLEVTPRGTARIHGRADGVMNVGGVRIGPAEIYAALEDVDELAATMAIEQRCAAAPGGSRIVLFVVLRGGFELTRELQARIRRQLAQKCSRAHVPAVIAALGELPETHNFKRAERAARDAANGDPVANIDALRNPGVLDVIRAHPALSTVIHSDAPPRGDIEQELSAIWAQILGVRDVAVDDNFFDLGGQSLNAVLLSTAMQHKFDVEFPISAFLHAPTVARCAEVIREARARSDASIAKPQSFRALVKIKGGAGVPFFCVHGAGGNVLNFRDLSLALPADRPFYGLQAHGVDGVTPVLPSIEAMAQAYLDQVREAQPYGPYLLGGYSGGGVVAFEMARRLTAAGEEVALLALFDTRHPQSRAHELTFAERVARLREERFGYVREIAQRRATSLREMRERRELDRCLRAGARIPYALRDLHLRSTFIAAQTRYLPASWPGRATLFRAETVEHVYRGNGPAYGWEKHVLGGLDVVVVPGGHHTLVLGSNAQILAKSLEGAIEAALGRASRGREASAALVERGNGPESLVASGQAIAPAPSRTQLS
jgi:acetoacetyl-CoA synthetase